MNDPVENTLVRTTNIWRLFKRVLKLALIAFLLYLVLVPFIQPWLVAAYSIFPTIAVLLLGCVVAFCMYKAQQYKCWKWNPWCWIALAIFVVVGTLVTSITNGWDYFVDWQIASNISPTQLSKAPTSIQNRLVPRSISPELINGDNPDNRTASSTPHIVEDMTDGQLYWQASMPYSNVWYGKFSLFHSIRNVVRANAKTMKVDLESGKDAFFLFGPDSLFTRTLFRLRHPFAHEGRPVFWQKPDGGFVYLIPCISYRMTWTATMIPDIVGVMEFGGNGSCTSYSVEEAANLFKGAALFPLELGRQRIIAYCKFHNGFWNPIVLQKDLFEISEDPPRYPGDNQPPYLQIFQEIGLQQLFELEPKGSTSFALRETFYLNAITGSACAYVEPEKDPNPVHGGRKAIHDITSSDWNMNWEIYKPEEPLAVNLSGGRRYHLVFITKKGDNPGTSVRFILVDARDRTGHNAKSFDKQEELESYLTSLSAQAK